MIQYCLKGDVKMKKLLLSIMLAGFIFTGCSNKLVEKAVEQGKAAIVNKQYNKALISFEIALDEDKTNKEAQGLYELVNTLLQAQKAYEENKLTDAVRILDKLQTIEGYTLIKSEVEALENQIEQKQKTDTVTTKQPNQSGETSSEQAQLDEQKKEQEQINESSEQPKQQQQNEQEQKEEQEKKQQQEQKQDPQSKQQKSKQTISEQQAVELVKKKIIQVEGSFPEYLTISVDHVEGNNYVVHCYEVVNNGPEDQHTATYNWYHVNKYTGAVSSMF